MSEPGKCDFCGERTQVSCGDHMGANGYSAICEACADAAICDFLGDKDDDDE